MPEIQDEIGHSFSLVSLWFTTGESLSNYSLQCYAINNEGVHWPVSNATLECHPQSLLLRANCVFPLFIQHSWDSLLPYSSNSCLYRLNSFCHSIGIQQSQILPSCLIQRCSSRFWCGGGEGRVPNVLGQVSKKKKEKLSRCT